MKANELMIDDWVYNKNIDKPMQVYPMMFSQMFRQRPDATTEDYNIFPIPITPEILEKNGFEICNEDTDGAIQYECGSQALGIDIWINTKPYLLGAWRTWDGETKSYTMVEELPINYVHELQHAMRLCGIEKEIEL